MLCQCCRTVAYCYSSFLFSTLFIVNHQFFELLNSWEVGPANIDRNLYQIDSLSRLKVFGETRT